jgi:plastocyanin domain-containing protein
MSFRSLLASLAAAIALAAGPALAQSHTMHAAPSDAAAGIAEGTVKGGVRVVEMKVTDEGFVPSKVKVKRGEKVRLLVTRTTDSTCAKEIVMKDAGINQPLPLDETVKVEFVAKRSGELRYACGMDMISGVVFVQ